MQDLIESNTLCDRNVRYMENMCVSWLAERDERGHSEFEASVRHIKVFGHWVSVCHTDDSH